MVRLRVLALAPLALLAACDDGTGTGPRGDVRGSVMVEGVSLVGVTVELTGPENRSATTDGAGGYEFTGVPTGAYVVSIRNVPADASFPATSRTAVVSGSRAETVNFVGNFIRTSSIGGTVLAGSRGLGGVTVLLTGDVARSAITDANGIFRFTGLRSADYVVEILGFPASVTFFNTAASVSLATGETHLVTFAGQPQLTASATIRSVVRRLADGSTEVADPMDLKGSVEVTVTVDRGEDTLESLEFLLGDVVVGAHSFLIGGAAPVSAPFDIVFPLDTDAFDPETGAVEYPNGPRLLRVRLATLEGGPDAWQTTIQVRLRNQNTVTGMVTAERGPVTGQDGNTWLGGAVTVVARPVLYDPSVSIASLTFELRRVEGPQLRMLDVEGTAPFQGVFGGSGTEGVGNVVGYQTPSGEADQVRVLGARTPDGTPLTGFPVVIVTELRVDNLGPVPGGFRLPEQGASADCCLNNWIGGAFELASGLDAASDGGVGGVSFSIHVGPAEATDAQIVELPPTTSGAELDPTDGNSAYRAVARLGDLLGNTALVPLVPSEGNPISNIQGAVFGVDTVAPQLAFGPGSVADRAANPVAGTSWLLVATEELSGIGPLPARTRVLRRAPGVEGTAACPFPQVLPCAPARDGLQREVPSGSDGYFAIESWVLDRAGNRSNTVLRTVLRDGSPPRIHSLQVPSGPVAGSDASFSAQVSDDIDVMSGTIGLRFEASEEDGETLTFAAPGRIGEPFSGVLTTEGFLSETFPVVVSLERATVGTEEDEPSGILLPLAGARVTVLDAAGGVASATNALPALGGADPQGFSVAVRGEAGGVAGWEVGAGADDVCRASASGECPTGVQSTVRITARALGLEAVFELPFQRVYFYVERAGELEWIGASSAPTLTEGTGERGRTWSWDIDWTPGTDAPEGATVVRAAGVDAGGRALLTGASAPLTVLAGS